MRHLKWQILLGVALVILSAIFYLIHYALFRDAHHIFIYMVGDIAFVFIEVLMVTLIIHQILSAREKRARLEKLNMVIGTFFSEVGTTLLTFLSDLDPRVDKIRNELIVTNDWSGKDFAGVSKRLKSYEFAIDIKKGHLEDLRAFLSQNRDFLLRLLENPNLLEHESFTELLRSVFHFTEEITNRKSLKGLPSTDYEHLTIDTKRIYHLLVQQWLFYMKYLKDSYPYLFSFAMRTNPFDQNATPIVR